MRLLLLLLLGVAAHAAALPPESVPLAAGLARGIPGEALRGVMPVPEQGVVSITGVRLAVAAGLQIRDSHNRIVLPASLSQPHQVKYLVDAQGRLSRVWILTEAEAARP